MNFYNQDIKKIKSHLNTSLDGLSQKEAKSRLAKNGKNKLAEQKKKSIISTFFAQMKDTMIIVLLVACVISTILALIQKQYVDLIDSGVILFIVIINAVIGVVQQGKADKSMEMLKNLNKPFAKVLRDGEIERISSEDLVVGDIVILEAGDYVPADLRLFETASLKIDESALTGESLPVSKFEDIITAKEVPLGDRKNMAYSSTIVTYGRAKGIVTATGMETEIGKIAKMLTTKSNQITPLQNQLNKTAKLLSIVILGITAVIFIASLIKNGISTQSITHSFMTAIAIAVAAIPESLTAVVTIVLAIGVKEMCKRNAIVKNLPAVETLGCCQIICSDKTGTLTQNVMTVMQLFTMSNSLFSTPPKTQDKSFDYLIKDMLLCNDSIINSNGEIYGDPTETALIKFAETNKIDYSNILMENKRVAEYPFDSDRKMMTTVNEIDGVHTCYTKGAVDKMLSKCSKIMIGDKIREMTDKDKETIINANSQMTSSAYRVLACAVSFDEKTVEQDLTFVGLVGMIDPPRPEVTEAVKKCKTAGIKPIMITGDHLNTAIAIAKEIGIYDENSLAITGEELDKLSDEEFSKNLMQYSIFARVSPENKVRIVTTLKNHNFIVAMTGDGVNDAPSLKTANVGVGMGITGTDVSKEASDIILTDDNFATIVSSVEEGRRIYSNIQKVIKYLLSANIAEVLCLFIATIFLLAPHEEFLSPVMILWINLITDSIPALSLAYEKAERNIMNKKPRKSNSNLLGGTVGLNIVIQGLLQTILTMSSYIVGAHLFNSHVAGTTMAFITLSLIQLFHVYNCKCEKSLFSRNPFKNKFLNISFVLGIVLIIVPIVIPAFSMYFGFTSLTFTQWIISILCAFAIIPLVEIEKILIKLTLKHK